MYGCVGRSWDCKRPRFVGESQSVLVVINPMISPATRDQVHGGAHRPETDACDLLPPG
eukprot:COSAG01_NODE_68714_length_263_cov_0.890244_1_plen_57_part_01